MSRDKSKIPELQRLAKSIVGQCREGEQVEVYVASGSRVSVKACNEEIESFSSATSSGIGVRVVSKNRQGFASAGSLDPEIAVDALAEARDNCTFGESDEHLGLAEPDGIEAVEQELWNPAVLELDTDDKIALALRLEREVKAADSRVTGVRSASYGDSAGEAVVMTSTGIDVSGRGTACHVGVSALARDGEETTIGAASDVGRDPGSLDVDDVVLKAVERALRLLGAKKPSSQRLPVVFDPRMASSFFGIVGSTMSGSSVVKGRSPFVDRLGELVASECVTLVDDPTNSKSLSADSHDGEGLACRRNVLIDSGTLDRFLHNSYTGRRSGGASTGSAVRGYGSRPGVGATALALEPGSRSESEIIADLDNAFLVQSMKGLHSGVNGVSGDFSVGAEGMMIRNGELCEPVKEATIASSIQKMLLGVVEVGSELEWLPSGNGMATVLFDEMSLSGE